MPWTPTCARRWASRHRSPLRHGSARAAPSAFRRMVPYGATVNTPQVQGVGPNGPAPFFLRDSCVHPAPAHHRSRPAPGAVSRAADTMLVVPIRLLNSSQFWYWMASYKKGDAMNCPSCRHENPVAARYCLECGTKLDLRCPACGEGLPDSAKFCLACGHNLSQAAALSDLKPNSLNRVINPKHLPKVHNNSCFWNNCFRARRSHSQSARPFY